MRLEESDGDRGAARTVAVTTARRAARPGALWGLVFGATIAASATSYSKTFPTGAARAGLARLEGNAAFEALFGPIRRMDTVSGYTAYKSGMFVLILGAIWGLLVATRRLRGEEDAGRWELFLSGRTTRGGAAVQAAIGLGVGAIALWVPTFLLTAAAGRSATVGIGLGASAFMATSVTAGVVMFMAVGMLVSQLAASRHDANVLGGAMIAAAYLLRMVADVHASLTWLRWTTPLGWIEELRPLTGSQPAAFLPIAILVVVLVAVAVRLAGRRDLGSSAFLERATAEARTFLLDGQAGLTLRLTRPVIVAWAVALAATGLVFGLVVQAAGNAMASSPGIQRVIARLGATSAGAAAYLGFVFVYAAVLVAVAVASQVVAIRNEETSGHLDNLLVRPISRWRWLSVRLLVGIAFVVLASALTGLAAWVGATTQHSSLTIGELVRAGLNTAPPAAFVLGIGALAYGLWPRGTIGVTYGVIVWSFLVEILAALVNSNHWLLDTSPFLHIAPAPAAAPDWTAAVWLVGLGLVAGLIGLAAFVRRDLVGA
jgi:ABC-2 type transport system permease protein